MLCAHWAFILQVIVTVISSDLGKKKKMNLTNDAAFRFAWITEGRKRVYYRFSLESFFLFRSGHHSQEPGGGGKNLSVSILRGGGGNLSASP